MAQFPMRIRCRTSWMLFALTPRSARSAKPCGKCTERIRKSALPRRTPHWGRGGLTFERYRLVIAGRAAWLTIHQTIHTHADIKLRLTKNTELLAVAA